MKSFSPGPNVIAVQGSTFQNVISSLFIPKTLSYSKDVKDYKIICCVQEVCQGMSARRRRSGVGALSRSTGLCVDSRLKNRCSLQSTNSSPSHHGCQMAKFDPFLSLDCARVEGRGRNPRKGRDQTLQRSVAEP